MNVQLNISAAYVGEMLTTSCFDTFLRRSGDMATEHVQENCLGKHHEAHFVPLKCFSKREQGLLFERYWSRALQ